MAELLTRRLKRVMQFVVKHFNENNYMFNFTAALSDNYKSTFCSLALKQAIINMIIDTGLIYIESTKNISSTNLSPCDQLDIQRYKYILFQQYNIPKKDLAEDKRIEKFIQNCLIEA